ncbi:MAG TPA: hypothetical protein VH116_11060 [Gemmatimonadales bacterium]|nr:hypothetical protein [Gemmatimonadales bacterium]
MTALLAIDQGTTGSPALVVGAARRAMGAALLWAPAGGRAR